MSTGEPTHLSNVDLEIRARWRLDPLVAALGHPMHTIFVGRLGRMHCAHFETFVRAPSVSRLVVSMAAQIAALRGSARRCWRTASHRVFDIGIQGGRRPNHSEFRIDADAIAAVHSIGARIVISVYGTDILERTSSPD